MGLVAKFLQMLIFNTVGQEGRIHSFHNDRITILAIVQ